MREREGENSNKIENEQHTKSSKLRIETCIYLRMTFLFTSFDDNENTLKELHVCQVA